MLYTAALAISGSQTALCPGLEAWNPVRKLLKSSPQPWPVNCHSQNGSAAETGDRAQQTTSKRCIKNQPSSGRHETTMGIGKTILRIRIEKGLTQRELGEAADLASTYISRIENGRVQASTTTLGRIASALDVPVTELLNREARHVPSTHKPCPVSQSGKCIGAQLRSGHGRLPLDQASTYSKEQLHLLRITDKLAHHGKTEIRTTLRVFLEALLERASKNP